MRCFGTAAHSNSGTDMTDEPTVGALRMPASAHEFWALALALLAVFGLVQVGAPIVRELDFLDQKIRDYFIGIAFAAFPFIHRGCKQTVLRLKPAEIERHDLPPWFVTGAIAAALLYAWNMFVSMLGGLAVGLFIGAVGQIPANEEAVNGAAITSVMAVSLPLSAVASIFAGILLNRHTRANVFAALAFAAVMFIAFNALTTWVLQPKILAAQINAAFEMGPEGIAYFFIGMGLVAAIVFVFGGVGVLISRFYREGAIGRITEAARRLPSAEREVLAADIERRLAAAPGARFAAMPAAPAQAPTAAEP
jgi:hypothetical protein